jgi:hypothetical protein
MFAVGPKGFAIAGAVSESESRMDYLPHGAPKRLASQSASQSLLVERTFPIRLGRKDFGHCQFSRGFNLRSIAMARRF